MHRDAMNVLEDLSMERVQGHAGSIHEWGKMYISWLASFSVLTQITRS